MEVLFGNTENYIVELKLRTWLLQQYLELKSQQL